MIFELFTSLNSSKVFGAFLMFVMNIGSKYIGKDIPLGVDIIFDNFWARMFVVLCIAFISTRDIVTSIMILLLYILVFSYILNDKSKSCVLRKTIDAYKKKIEETRKPTVFNDITEEEVIMAKETLRRYEVQKKINGELGDILYL
jgi:hypothetical protein